MRGWENFPRQHAERGKRRKSFRNKRREFGWIRFAEMRLNCQQRAPPRMPSRERPLKVSANKLSAA